MTPQLALDFSADVARDRERLKTLAGELALRAGRAGVTAGDVRIAAVNRGILTGSESAARMKALNLGGVMAEAGLVRSSQYRRSNVTRSHGNLHCVYTLLEFAEVA